MAVYELIGGPSAYQRRKFIDAHVVTNQQVVNLKRKNGETFTSIILAKDDNLDLALIAVSRPGLPIPLRSRTPEVGQDAFALGHLRGLEFALTKGLISAIRELPFGVGNVISSVFCRLMYRSTQETLAAL